jgi:hypothetical protein
VLLDEEIGRDTVNRVEIAASRCRRIGEAMYMLGLECKQLNNVEEDLMFVLKRLKGDDE